MNKTTLGIELGSTRIKAVLLDEAFSPLASGSFQWENKQKDGIWTYPEELIREGLQKAYKALKTDFEKKTGQKLTRPGAFGVSAMMHGYLPFDRDMRLLTEFRTWRNTMTGEAAEKLTEAFHFNIPQRWSVAHLYQAILNREAHVSGIDHLTTLAGYIHYLLTGEKVLGIGDASGMFPLNAAGTDYDQEALEKFDTLHSNPWKLRQLLPKILKAGENAGYLTEEGANFLDPEGDLKPGIPAAPPEGDAGTGMVATNSVRISTGNVSAGTSIFAMLVAAHPLGLHREIDVVATPSGAPVAMVHCNNCTSDLNDWLSMLRETLDLFGTRPDTEELYTKLLTKALEGAPDCGGILSYNYYSGEGVTDIDDGRPLLVRRQAAGLELASFMRAHISSCFATLAIGLDILLKEEHMKIDRLYGHGGLFKTPRVGQEILSSAVGAPVSVMETAGEGGPYGMALLAAYMLRKEKEETLEDFLDRKVFPDVPVSVVMAEPEEISGFARYLEDYKKAFALERSAVELL